MSPHHACSAVQVPAPRARATPQVEPSGPAAKRATQHQLSGKESVWAASCGGGAVLGRHQTPWTAAQSTEVLP